MIKKLAYKNYNLFTCINQILINIFIMIKKNKSYILRKK